MGRLYGRIVKTRLEGIVQDAEQQCGFCAGRSCIDNIFCLKQLGEKSISYGLETSLTFVDLRKAYDTVPINKLWNVMRAAGINEIYVKVLKSFYENNVSAIKIGNKVSETFKVTKGLRQGCAMAPTLFKIYINEALKKWKKHCEVMGIPINDKFLYTLLFADDQVVVAMDEQDSSYMIRKLHEQYKQWGLDINYEKTEQLIIGREGNDMVIGSNTIRDCVRFKYLGVIITKEGTSNEEIDNKIIQGRKAIGKLNSVLWNDKITMKTKKDDLLHDI